MNPSEFLHPILNQDGIERVSIKILKRAEYYAQHVIEVRLLGLKKFKTTLGKLEALGLLTNRAVKTWRRNYGKGSNGR